MTVACFLCEQLASWGIDRIFGVSGANIELVFDAAIRHETMDAVLAKHEASAATMATGWQERSGLPGVVATTSGGAAFNIVAALSEALDSGFPIISLVGQSPMSGDGRGAFQDTSGVGTRVVAEQVLGAVSVRCERVTDPARVPGALRDAVAAAIRERGPAVLLLPRDVQSGACDAEPMPFPRIAAPGGDPPALSPRLVRRIEAAIGGAFPPLLIAGRGALAPSIRAELEQLADAWGTAVAVTPDAKSAVASADPRLLGVTGVMGHRAVADYARRTSVCVLVGTRLPDVSAYGLLEPLAAATIVSVNERPCFPGLAGHGDVHELSGDAAVALRALRSATRTRFATPTRSPTSTRPATSTRCPTATADAWRPEEPRHHPDAEPTPTSEQVVRILAAHLEPGADVFIDAGNAGAFAVHHLPSDGAGLRSIVLGMGAMGHAFGAAIGACEYTGRRTYVIAGDGAFYMSGMEIHTAIERRLPVTFVILNNNAHAMCRLREELLLGGASTLNAFAPARIADGVRAMFPSIDAAEAESHEQLGQALLRARQSPGPSIISVTTAADEQPPFWPLVRTPTEQELAA